MRETSAPLLERLLDEKNHGIHGGIYHKIQVDLAYNSNHIEGSRLSHDQTRYIFETHSLYGDISRMPRPFRGGALQRRHPPARVL